MVEIYQEQLIDLLAMQPVYTGDHLIDDQNKTYAKELKIKESSVYGTHVEGLTTASIISEDEMIDILRVGENNRHMSSTKMNIQSSRSHSLCIIQVIQRYANDSVKRGIINLVDLAGSERVSKSYAQGA